MIKWSFSGLKQFLTCAKQYHEIKVLKNFEVRETEQIRYGKEVHSALEDYVRDGTPLAKNYLRFKNLMDVLVAIPGEKYPEHKMALTIDKQPCGFEAPEYWVRGIADFISVDSAVAHVADYKTGSARFPEPKQLKLMALLIFRHFPEVTKVKGALLFVMHDKIVTEEYDRKEEPELWKIFEADLSRLHAAYEKDTWMPNPSGLCRGWCPVKTCTFYEERF